MIDDDIVEKKFFRQLQSDMLGILETRLTTSKALLAEALLEAERLRQSTTVTIRRSQNNDGK